MGLQLASIFTVVSFISVEQQGNTTGSILVMGKRPWTRLKSPKHFPIFCTLLSKSKWEKKKSAFIIYFTQTPAIIIQQTPNLKKRTYWYINHPPSHSTPFSQTQILKKWMTIWCLFLKSCVHTMNFVEKGLYGGWESLFMAPTVPGKQEQLDLHSLLQTLEHLNVIVSDVFKMCSCVCLAHSPWSLIE